MNESSPPVFDAKDVVSEGVRPANDGPDHGIQAGAVPSTRQDSDFLHWLLHVHFSGRSMNHRLLANVFVGTGQRPENLFYNKACVFWRSIRVPSAAVSV